MYGQPRLPAPPPPQPPPQPQAGGDLNGLCCPEVQPHVPTATHWDGHVYSFLSWLVHNGARQQPTVPSTVPEFIIKLTTSVTHGRKLGEIFYAANVTAGVVGYQFRTITFSYAQNFQTRTAYKNYHCPAHGLYFQIDVLR